MQEYVCPNDRSHKTNFRLAPRGHKTTAHVYKIITLPFKVERPKEPPLHAEQQKFSAIMQSTLNALKSYTILPTKSKAEELQFVEKVSCICEPVCKPCYLPVGQNSARIGLPHTWDSPQTIGLRSCS
jgi:hypothetical protein